MKPPPAPEDDTHVLIEHFWVEAGELERVDPEGNHILFARIFFLWNERRLGNDEHISALLKLVYDAQKDIMVEFLLLSHQRQHVFLCFFSPYLPWLEIHFDT